MNGQKSGAVFYLSDRNVYSNRVAYSDGTQGEDAEHLHGFESLVGR